MTNSKNNENNQEKKEKTEEKKEFLPPLDFSSLVLPFYTQALIKLGLMEDPLTKKSDENFELSKRLIDLLDLLKERTKGNLKSEEEVFLESCLTQLKMNYLKKAKIMKF